MTALDDILATTGVTYRQLDHWVRRLWLHPSKRHPGNGHARTWTDEELQVAATMARLVAAGLNPARAHRVARGDTHIAPGIRITIDQPEAPT